MSALRCVSLSTFAVGALALVPTIEIAPGVHLPQITLGGINVTWMPFYPDVSNYSLWIETGERGFDTAWEYDTSRGISEAIKVAGLKRSEVFITTKIPASIHGGSARYKNNQTCPTYMTPEMARAHIQENLEQLDLDYVDLLLMHEPMDFLAPYPYNATKETADVYAVMEEAFFNGTAKAIGVSNFQPVHFEPLLKTARVKPVINQARLSLGNADWETIEYCRQHNITYQGYSVLHYGGCDGTDAVSSPTVQRIASAHNMSIYQVQLRWISQHGFGLVACTNKSSHMTSDIQSLGFTLTHHEMNTLDACAAWQPTQLIV
jgi:diketogulonate reductase-like aldo/keto reductase